MLKIYCQGLCLRFIANGAA